MWHMFGAPRRARGRPQARLSAPALTALLAHALACGGETSALPAPTFSISGIVTGLPAPTSIPLTLNGAETLQTSAAFSFQEKLPSGASYAVTLGTAPAGFACTIANGAGVVSNADVTNVAVTCFSTQAALSSLSTSAGPLSPMFDPAQLHYTTKRKFGVFPSFEAMPSATVTATLADPNASLLIMGAMATSGVPSSPLALLAGLNSIPVKVTAADHATSTTYTVDVTGYWNHYLKAPVVRNRSPDPPSFGTSMAIDGDTLAVGDPADPSCAVGVNGDPKDTNCRFRGAVHLYTRAGETWTESAYIKPPTFLGNNFGWSVALQGDILAVGNLDGACVTGFDTQAPKFPDQNNCGASGGTFVFHRAPDGTWSFDGYMGPQVSATGVEYCGSAVAVSGSEVAIACLDHLEFFTRILDDNWVADGATVPQSGEAQLLSQLALSGDTAVLTGLNAGGVFTFRRAGASSWPLEVYLKPPIVEPSLQASFGSSVALDGDSMLVGASDERSCSFGVNGDQTNTGCASNGAAYVYTRTGDTWALQAYLKGQKGVIFQDGLGFGTTVSLKGDVAVVGAAHDADCATGVNAPVQTTNKCDTGVVYTFQRSGGMWSEGLRIKPSHTAEYSPQGFGTVVAFSGTSLAVAAPNEAGCSPGVDGDQTMLGCSISGAVYLY